MHQIPDESLCIVEAERRGMTVPIWSPSDADDYFWRIIFVRADGTALLLPEPLLLDNLRAFVCPTLTAAIAGDAFVQGYGEIECVSIPALLDTFARWTYGGLDVASLKP